jgi:hypothetical protein
MNTVTLRANATTTAALSLISWVAAALLVAFIHNAAEPVSPAACAILKAIAVIGVAFVLMRLTRDELTVDGALFIGMLWAAMAMVTEVVVSAQGGRSWYALLGSPDRKVLRDVLLLAWIGAPALFARRPE